MRSARGVAPTACHEPPAPHVSHEPKCSGAFGCESSGCHISPNPYPSYEADSQMREPRVTRCRCAASPCRYVSYKKGRAARAAMIECDVTGLLAWRGGQPGQVGNEAATAVFRQCRGSGSSPRIFTTEQASAGRVSGQIATPMDTACQPGMSVRRSIKASSPSLSDRR